MDGDPAEASRSGRPRREKTRLAILDATADILLSNGLSETTISAIAARAQASKVTIYRWWPSLGAVAIDAYFHRFLPTTVTPDSGNTVTDLSTQVLHLTAALRGRPGEIMAELLGQAQFAPDLHEALRERWFGPRWAASTAVLQRGVERGEIRSDVSVSIVLDEIFGPVYLRLMTRQQPLSDELVGEMVRNVLRGVAN